MKRNKGRITKEERKKHLKKQYNEDSERGVFYTVSKEILKGFRVKDYYKSKDGDNFIAFLPQRNVPTFFKLIYVHFGVGGTKNSYLCPKKMFDEKCPICKYLQKLKAAGEPDDVLSDFTPRKRYIFFVVDMENKAGRAKGVQLFDAPSTVGEGVKAQAVNPKTKEAQDVSDIDENLIFYFIKTGSGKFNTKYKGFKLIDGTKPLNEKLLKRIPDFDSVLILPDVKAMKNDLLGLDDESSDYEDDDDDVSKKKKKKKGKRDKVRSAISSRKNKYNDYDEDDDDDDLPF